MTWDPALLAQFADATLAQARDAVASLLLLDAASALAVGAVLVGTVALAAYRMGLRHRESQARRLRERLVGRLHPRASA